MRIVSELPRQVREIENIWIPMSDGPRLAARMWVPVDADENPVPAIFEYHPYRKNDESRQHDSVVFPYLAGHGYACARVDLRGSGDSEGILYDEYLPQEQQDGAEVVQWLAEQEWCTGAVGMIGASWSGFNALQVAALRPPALKAVVSCFSTDDRYASDAHYHGGCILAQYMLPWASKMMARNARPPDPQIVGERWREMWLERLERTPPFIEPWLSHQHRDAYWKQGSVCEDYAAIECPVYMVGGWSDCYRDSVLRFVSGHTGPRKALIGPWSHGDPSTGPPGPGIGFRQEVLRWFDHWLKGRDTGIMDEPLLRTWMQESVTPSTFHSSRPGRWIAEPSWPSPNVSPRTFAITEAGLTTAPGEETRIEHRGSQAIGLEAGDWVGYGGPGDWPADQRGEDGHSLTFTSEALTERLEILGAPGVTLSVASDRPNALLAVRLCDVHPSGESLLVTRGLLNLTHRDGHEAPTPLKPGQRYAVRVPLGIVAHAFPPGHRIRLGVSTAYWPWAWPSPEPVTLSVFAGGESRLELPEREPDPADARLRPFDEPEGAQEEPAEILRVGLPHHALSRDLAEAVHVLTVSQDHAGHRRLLSNGIDFELTGTTTFSINEGEPLSASVRCNWDALIGRDEWRTRVETTSAMAANAHAFLVTCCLHAFEGESRVLAKTWSFEIPRQFA